MDKLRREHGPFYPLDPNVDTEIVFLLLRRGRIDSFYPLDPNVDTEITFLSDNGSTSVSAFYPLDPNVDTEIIKLVDGVAQEADLSTPSIQTWILKLPRGGR